MTWFFFFFVSRLKLCKINENLSWFLVNDYMVFRTFNFFVAFQIMKMLMTSLLIGNGTFLPSKNK